MPAKPLTIVITGASRGLGAGMAQYFKEQGHNLGLCSRSKPCFENDERTLSRSLDVRDAAAVESFTQEVVQTFGQIDLWIGNAGVLEPMRALRAIELEEFERREVAKLEKEVESKISQVFEKARGEWPSVADGLVHPFFMLLYVTAKTVRSTW